MTPEEYATEVAVELAARNADIPFDAALMLETKTWPPGGPKITPRQTADVWFQMRLVASMTAAEWETAGDPAAMLTRVRFHVPDEKFTRFACECCRRIWDVMPGDDVRRIVAATEDVLQDKLGRDERDELFAVLTESFMGSLSGAARSAADAAGELFELGFYTASAASLHAAEARAGGATEGPGYAAERAAQAALLRELLGHPLRPVAFDPSWRTPTVVSLASRVVESQDYSAMPILADALLDAGCDNADVLDHCRGRDEHVRGCWVVDLVLGSL